VSDVCPKMLPEGLRGELISAWAGR
jgi:hypothetical protein